MTKVWGGKGAGCISNGDASKGKFAPALSPGGGGKDPCYIFTDTHAKLDRPISLKKPKYRRGKSLFPRPEHAILVHPQLANDPEQPFWSQHISLVVDSAFPLQHRDPSVGAKALSAARAHLPSADSRPLVHH